MYPQLELETPYQYCHKVHPSNSGSPAGLKRWETKAIHKEIGDTYVLLSENNDKIMKAKKAQMISSECTRFSFVIFFYILLIIEQF